MTFLQSIPVLFVIAMTVATVALGIYATRKAQTASDFFVAGRSVSVFWNASAISGEYLSAASFMGIAGLVMKNGYDALWYPACFAAGYLFLLLFIAGPLRRFGAYTIPDFAEGRFDSPGFRKVAVTFVLFIGFFYTMPQLKGAGQTMTAILGWPYWAGIAVVGAVITFNVALGGMKGITFVQAFQYWAKVFAISLPVFVLASVFGNYSSNLATNDEAPGVVPLLTKDTTLTIKGAVDAPSNVLSSPAGKRIEMVFPEGAKIAKVGSTRKLGPGETVEGPIAWCFRAPVGAKGPVTDLRNGTQFDIALNDGEIELPPWSMIHTYSPFVLGNGRTLTVKGQNVFTSARIEFAEAARVTLFQDKPVPNAPVDGMWLHPFGPFTSKHGYPLLYTYSLIIALICGTAGLPHILVRFYTNPDGRAAKRTTLWVMVMLGGFYVFPPVWGVIGRDAIPELYANFKTDLVVIQLPMVLKNEMTGQILSGITSAGAFAAFMSTFSGLLVSMSGALAHDIYGKILVPTASARARLLAFKLSAVLIGVASMSLALLVESFDIAMMVGWAFAIAASSYFPLLLLGSWWRGLTKFGAGSGMLSGGMLSLGAIVASMLLDKKVLTFSASPLVRSLMEQPAIWAVPLAITVMVIVSMLTQPHIPDDIHMKMLRLHAPEELGLSKNYIDQ
jgi:Na+(H+)/acetate symporter ActP